MASSNIIIIIFNYFNSFVIGVIINCNLNNITFETIVFTGEKYAT